MRKVGFTVVCALWCLIGAASLAAPQDDFVRANEFYRNKEYNRAIEAYEQVASQGVESPELYYNLGNAYFKSGNLGYSVLYYLKARRLDPTDEDIRANLAFARSMATIQLEGVQLNPINTLLENIVGPYRLNTLAWVTSLVFVLLFGALITRFGFGYVHAALKGTIIILLVALVAGSLLTTFKYHNDYLTRWAVVVGDNSEIRSGPTDQAGLEFQGEPGLIVRITAESGDYFDVVFENQRRGWIRKSSIAEV